MDHTIYKFWFHKRWEIYVLATPVLALQGHYAVEALCRMYDSLLLGNIDSAALLLYSITTAFFFRKPFRHKQSCDSFIFLNSYTTVSISL
jgi:hypothetical protein